MMRAAALASVWVCVLAGATSFAQDTTQYRVLATNKTSTMQKEMQDAGDAGFEYRGQSVFKRASAAKKSSSSWNATRKPQRRAASSIG